MTEKTEGNFLYIKFVMDAILEGKIGFSLVEINKMPRVFLTCTAFSLIEWLFNMEKEFGKETIHQF
jgi:hypothetical protein